MSQLFFEFYNSTNSDNFKEEDFLTLPENLDAQKTLQQFFSQKVFIESQQNSLVLKGPNNCGKTHLLNIFAKKFNAEFIAHEEIIKNNPLNFFTANNFYIIDDSDEISEEMILHWINSAHECKAFLLIAGNFQKKISLHDLKSRIKNIFHCEIKSPSTQSLKEIFINNLARKQIILKDSVIDFIFVNIAQTYQSIAVAIKRIDFFCRETGRKLTIKDARSMF